MSGFGELDGLDFTPGEVIDGDALDAKLIKVRMKGAPHFTGVEMALVEEHYRKSMTELTAVEMQVATAFIYMRRVKGERITWQVAEKNATLEVVDETENPTDAASSETS